MSTPPDTPSQTPAIVQAAKDGRLLALRRLVRGGADINAPDERGTTALMHAILEGRDNCTKCLLHTGADVNIANHNGSTALMYAAWCIQPKTTRLLLGKGADVHSTDQENRNALFYAALELEEQFPVWQSFAQALVVGGFFSLLGLGLLFMGHWGEFTRNTACIICATMLLARLQEWRRDHAAAATVRTLIDAGASTGAALLYAVQNGWTRTVKRLIAAGADIHATNEHGETALQLAEKAGHTDIVRALKRAEVRQTPHTH